MSNNFLFVLFLVVVSVFVHTALYAESTTPRTQLIERINSQHEKNFTLAELQNLSDSDLAEISRSNTVFLPCSSKDCMSGNGVLSEENNTSIVMVNNRIYEFVKQLKDDWYYTGYVATKQIHIPARYEIALINKQRIMGSCKLAYCKFPDGVKFN